jgi:hypothetical protein
MMSSLQLMESCRLRCQTTGLSHFGEERLVAGGNLYTPFTPYSNQPRYHQSTAALSH